MILSADQTGIILADPDADQVSWVNVLCIFGVQMPEDGHFYLFVDAFVSGIKRFRISETEDGFQTVLAAVDQHLERVVTKEDRLTVDWGQIISGAEQNERVFIWWADQYTPGSWPTPSNELLGHFLVHSPFYEQDENAPTDLSVTDVPYYDWLDTEAAKFTNNSPQEFTSIEVLYWLQAEVLNGGLLQYFTNSFSDRAEDAVQALQMISATDAADALESAIRIAFGHTYPVDVSQRQALLECPGDDVLRSLDQLDFSVATGWLGLLHDHITNTQST